MNIPVLCKESLFRATSANSKTFSIICQQWARNRIQWHFRAVGKYWENNKMEVIQIIHNFNRQKLVFCTYSFKSLTLLHTPVSNKRYPLKVSANTSKVFTLLKSTIFQNLMRCGFFDWYGLNILLNVILLYQYSETPVMHFYSIY
jgi:hypothetical protein